MRKVILFAVCILLGACSHSPQHDEPRVDGSSVDAFHHSWRALTASLTQSQQSQLNLAVLRIGLSDVKSAADLQSRPTNITPDDIRGKVNGLTFAGILKLAEESPTKTVGAGH